MKKKNIPNGMTDREIRDHYRIAAKKKEKNREEYLNILRKRYYGPSFGGVKTIYDLRRIRILFPCRLDCNGECCHCGSCCERCLGLTTREKKEILDYLHHNPELMQRINEINKDLPHRMCPFLDHTKADHKCLIYNLPFYPKNCQFFSCDESKFNLEAVCALYNDEEPELVDMWHLIGDPVDISKAWKYKDSLRKCDLSLAPEILLYPEQFNELLWNELRFFR